MFLIFLYCRCKEEITKASGSEIAYVPAPCGRLNSVIKCNHPLTGLGLWLNQKRMQVKRKQTKKSQQKGRWKAIQLVLKGIEWPDQLSMKLRKTRELQVNLPLRKEVGFTIFIYLKTLVYLLFLLILRHSEARRVPRKHNLFENLM